jgi:hypothetical protein
VQAADVNTVSCVTLAKASSLGLDTVREKTKPEVEPEEKMGTVEIGGHEEW